MKYFVFNQRGKFIYLKPSGRIRREMEINKHRARILFIVSLN